MTKCKISVIIPVYNGEKYISDCLSSVMAQTYSNFEVIVINDGSTDRTYEILTKWACKYNKIQILSTENRGVSSARNLGIEHSKGDFLFFLDADDTIPYNALSTLASVDGDLIIGNFETKANWVCLQNSEIKCNKKFTNADILEYIEKYLSRPNKHSLFTYSWGRLFRASIVKDNNVLFDTQLKTFEDVKFNFEYLKHIREMYFIKDVVYRHTLMKFGESCTFLFGSDVKIMFGFVQALEKCREYLYSQHCLNIEPKLNNAIVCYTIIQLIRVCTQLNESNEDEIKKFVNTLLYDQKFQKSLKHYHPNKGDIRFIKQFMKLKLTSLVIFVCKKRGMRRYTWM